MMITPLRTWILPVISGVAAAYLLVTGWGFAVAYTWVPFVQWLWNTHHTTVRALPFDASAMFDICAGLLFGAALSYLVVRMTAGPLYRVWLLFAFGFFAVVTVPILFDDELNLAALWVVLCSPLLWAFGAASVVVFGFYSRSRAKAKNVA